MATAGGREEGEPAASASASGSWRLRMGSSDALRVPERLHRRPPFFARLFGAACPSHGAGKQRKIAKYYEKQESLLKDFSEMESMNELGCLDQNGRAAAIGERRKAGDQPVERGQPCPVRRESRGFLRDQVNGGDRVDAGLAVGSPVRVHPLVHGARHEEAQQVQLPDRQEAHAASGHRCVRVGDGVPGVPGADRVGAGAGDPGAHDVRHLEGDVDGGQHVVGGRRQVLPHALLPDLQERDRPGVRAGPLLRRDHQLRRPRQRPPRRQVQVVDGPRRRHTDRAVHDHDVGADGAGERGDADREVGAGGVPDQAHVPHLEPPRGDPAHRHREGLHLRDALLRGGGRGAPRGHAAQPGARHRGGAAGEAGAAAGGGARLRPRRLRVHAPARAQGRRLISSCSSPE